MSALHREYPDATPEQIDAKYAAALLGIGPDAPAPPPEKVYVERTCPECGDDFMQSATTACKRPSKWTTRCGYCLAYEVA